MMLKKPLITHIFFKTILFLSGLTLCIAYLLTQGENYSFETTKYILSRYSPQRIDQKIQSTTRWPGWFHQLDHVDHLGPIENDNIITLFFVSKRFNKKSFTLKVQVKDYLPEKLLHLKVIEDSSGQLTKLFKELEWKIALKPHQEQTIIFATILATTNHWKSRLYGKIAKKILLHQSFFPSLIALAEKQNLFDVQETVRIPYGI